MEQRLSLITLGTRDLARARAFYEALGWQTGAAPDDDVAFFQAGDMIMALWDRARLAEDSVVEDSGGWGGITLAMNVGSPEEVDDDTAALLSHRIARDVERELEYAGQIKVTVIRESRAVDYAK